MLLSSCSYFTHLRLLILSYLPLSRFPLWLLVVLYLSQAALAPPPAVRPLLWLLMFLHLPHAAAPSRLLTFRNVPCDGVLLADGSHCSTDLRLDAHFRLLMFRHIPHDGLILADGSECSTDLNIAPLTSDCSTY